MRTLSFSLLLFTFAYTVGISTPAFARFRAEERPSRRDLIRQSQEQMGGDGGTSFVDYHDRLLEAQQQRTKEEAERRSMRLIQNRTQTVPIRPMHGRGIRGTVLEHEVQERQNEEFRQSRRSRRDRITQSFRRRFQRDANAQPVQRQLKGGQEQRPIWHECTKFSGSRRAKCFYRTQRRTEEKAPEIIE